MWLKRARGGCSGWLPAGPPSGRRRSSVCQSLFWLCAPGLEPEIIADKKNVLTEGKQPVLCVAQVFSIIKQTLEFKFVQVLGDCSSMGHCRVKVSSEMPLFEGVFCPLVAFFCEFFFPDICCLCDLLLSWSWNDDDNSLLYRHRVDVGHLNTQDLLPCFCVKLLTNQPAKNTNKRTRMKNIPSDIFEYLLTGYFWTWSRIYENVIVDISSERLIEFNARRSSGCIFFFSHTLCWQVPQVISIFMLLWPAAVS